MRFQTILPVLTLILISFSFGCNKQVQLAKHSEVKDLLKNFEQTSGKSLGISEEQIDSCLILSSKRAGLSECFTVQTLAADLLPNFARVYPDLIAVAHNHIQDVNFCGLGRFRSFVYQNNPDGTMTYLPQEQWDSTYFYINGEFADSGPYLQFETFIQPCDGYIPECNGVNYMRIECWKDGVLYENQGECFIQINNSPSPVCDDTSADVDPWYPVGDFTIEYPAYSSINPETATGDFTGDFIVNTADLVYVLSRLCNQ